MGSCENHLLSTKPSTWASEGCLSWLKSVKVMVRPPSVLTSGFDILIILKTVNFQHDNAISDPLQ